MIITVKQLISQSWNLYKTSIKQFIAPLSYLVLTSAIITFATTIAALKPALVIPALLLGCIAILALIYINLTIIMGCWNVLNSQSLNWNELYASSYKKLGRFIFIAFVSGLIVVGGMILLIIPGIIFAIWYQFAALNQLLSDEKLTVSQALANSKNLVVGRWWQTLWKTIAPQIVFGFFVGLLGGVVGGLIPGSAQDFTNLTAVALENLGSIIISAIATPLLAFPTLLLYKSLKENPVATVDKN
ncbi:hypothetical protein IT409_02990 [Candidatus Falkowbacteria bacterium]|nr:hypothetical protein [Candidatus Falkowbacteria bacterium]